MDIKPNNNDNKNNNNNLRRRQIPSKHPHPPQDEGSTRVVPAVRSDDNSHTRVLPTTSRISSTGEAPPRVTDTGYAVNRRITTTGNPPPNSKVKPRNRKTSHTKQSYGEGGVSMLSSVMKAVMYIVSMFIISGFLAYYIIVISNDVFAFVKPDEQYEIMIDDYATVADIAKKLSTEGIIKYPKIFRLYAEIRKKADADFVAGTYPVSPSMNYDQLLAEFRAANVERDTISITIPEGSTVEDIIKIMISKGIGTRENYIDVIENHDFDYWFVKELTNLPETRSYRLEGYLFPDTYYFYTDASEVTVINKLLSNFNVKFPDEWRQACQELNMTVDQVVTLASMIQAEAKYITEYGLVSSVFHNRLFRPTKEINGCLESDATIQYALDERKETLTYTDTELDDPYNTYIHKGLPPGAICNPSLNAISFALSPDETNYYFFVARKNGYNEFAETYSQHLLNKEKVKNEP